MSPDYDFYAFAISWGPHLCCSKPEVCHQEKLGSLGNSLVPHGLWPMNYDGNYPTNCASDNFGGKRKGRRKHEWQKHGSCSTLSKDLYFAQEEALMKRPVVKRLFDTINLKSKSSSSSGMRTLSVSELDQEASKKIAVKASKYCHLQELTLCFNKAPGGLVGEQIDCPNSVLAYRNLVAKFGCDSLVVDSMKDSGSDGRCAFVSKELQRVLMHKKK